MVSSPGKSIKLIADTNTMLTVFLVLSTTEIFTHLIITETTTIRQVLILFPFYRGDN